MPNQPSVLNTTVYDSDDVIAAIHHVIDSFGSKKAWKSYKIRYLAKPVGLNERWARLFRTYNTTELEIGLLRPDKIGVLEVLARCGESMAHEKIVQDLVAVVSKMFYTKSADIEPMKIRLHSQADKSDLKRSAYRNLKEATESRRETLRSNLYKLAQFKKEVARLEAKVPGDRAKLDKFEERLKKSAARMKTAGLL